MISTLSEFRLIHFALYRLRSDSHLLSFAPESLRLLALFVPQFPAQSPPILQFNLFSFCTISKVTILNSFVSFRQTLSSFRKFSPRHQIRRSQLELAVLESQIHLPICLKENSKFFQNRIFFFFLIRGSDFDELHFSTKESLCQRDESDNSDDEQSEVGDD
jgi:hypothetical protein